MKKADRQNCCNSGQATDCGCKPAKFEVSRDKAGEAGTGEKILNIQLLVIDLETCERCVPTGENLRKAVELLRPAAEALGVDLRHRENVVRTPEEAMGIGLLSSPTIRINGRDIDQDMRESVCESCGDLTDNDTPVLCREWHYRGRVFSAAPLPMLVEKIMDALLRVDRMPTLEPGPLAELPGKGGSGHGRRDSKEERCARQAFGGTGAGKGLVVGSGEEEVTPTGLPEEGGVEERTARGGV